MSCRFMKRRFLSIVLGVCLLIPSTTVFASEVEDKESVGVESQVEDIHYLTEDLTRGSKKPGANASVHNLSKSNYNYQLTDFGYRLYTDKWLTSSSGKISVSLSNFKTIEEHPGATKNQITFRLYDSSGLISSSKKTVYGGSASTTFSNVKSGKKYYVAFEVPTNGNRYSGKGYISD